MFDTPNKPGAIVLGGHVSALAVARNLGERGIPIAVIDKTSRCIARHTQYCRFFRAFKQLDEPQALRDFLLSSDLAPLRGACLFPTSDATLEAVSRYKDSLATTYRVPISDWSTTGITYHKDQSLALAHRIGLAAPRTLPLYSSGIPLSQQHPQFRFPALLKPNIMHRFYRLTRRKAIFVKGFTDCDELLRRLSAHFTPEDFVLQEWIPGPPDRIRSFCSFTVAGTVEAFFINRHIRQIPMDIGKAATCVELIWDQRTYDQATAFLRALHFTGISEIEFKYDPEGRLLFLEMNARPWKQLRSGRLVEVDVAAAAWNYSMTSSVPLKLKLQDWQTYIERLAGLDRPCWIDLLQDFPTILRELARGRSSPKSIVAEYLGDVEFAVCSRADPRPLVYELLYFPYLLATR